MTNLYVVCGDERFLIDSEAERIRRLYPNHEFSAIEGEVNLDKLEQHLTAVSMWATAKFLLLKSPTFLGEKRPESEADRLEGILKVANQNGHVVLIVVYGSPDQRRKLVKFLKAHGEISIWTGFKSWEQQKLFDWMTHYAQRAGKSLNADACIALSHMGGMDLQTLANTIDQLAILLGSHRHMIELDDVRKLHGGQTISLFDFSSALADRNTKTILDLADSLGQHGEDPIKMLAVVAGQFRLFLSLIDLSEQKLNDQQIATKLGKNPYYIKKLLGPIKKMYTLDHLKDAMQQLQACDLRIKSGKQKAPDAFRQTLIKIFE